VALFGEAIPREGKPSNRQGRAASLIRNLGDTAFAGLGKALRKRKIDTTKFEAAREKYGSSKPEKVTEVALGLAGESSRDEWLEGLAEQVKEARKLAKAKRYTESLKALRGVLEQNPDFKSAKTAFPSVAVRVASGMSSGGKACALLEEAVKYSGAARAPLARHLLRGAGEDIDQIIVRDGPSHGGTVVHRLGAAELLGGQRDGDWVRVDVPGRKSPGYVHSKCVSPRGNGEFGASAAATPFEVVERVLKRVKDLSPDLTGEADKALGHLYARDGHALFLQGKYELATPLLDKAEQLAPNDPLLAEASGNWVKANANLVLLVGIFLGVALIGGFIVGKKLKAEMAGEDTSGQNLEILLELGVDEEFDEDDDEDDEADFVFANAGAHAAV
jgi:tetratricopeptide (TPR) repeat protein